MGIRLPSGNHDPIQLWAERRCPHDVRLVEAEFAGEHTAPRTPAAERLGPMRYGRQRMGMVPGLVGERLLRNVAG